MKWNVDFCKNSKFVQIFKIGLKNWLNQNIVDFTLDYFYFKGCLGPIRPIKSHISFYIMLQIGILNKRKSVGGTFSDPTLLQSRVG